MGLVELDSGCGVEPVCLVGFFLATMMSEYMCRRLLFGKIGSFWFARPWVVLV